MFNLFKRFKRVTTTKKYASAEELAQLTKAIQDICDEVEETNLRIVNNCVETSSGHNNYRLVQRACYFAKECVWAFGQEHSKDEFIGSFIEYLQQSVPQFEQQYDDPDGVGAGTITDIALKLQEATSKS